jgi:hypothetical protein
MPQPATAKCRVREDSDLAHVACPSVSSALKHRSADNATIGNSHHYGLTVNINFVEPDLDLCATGKVFSQESAVLLWYAFEELAELAAIMWDKKRA